MGRAARLQPQVDSSPSRHARLMALTTPAALTAYVKAVSRLPAGEDAGHRALRRATPAPNSQQPLAGEGVGEDAVEMLAHALPLDGAHGGPHPEHTLRHCAPRPAASPQITKK